jgi:hypothetical protein
VNQNKNLKEDALKAAAEKQAWDASVKSLVAAPSVLQVMSERLDWTQKLGEAFLAQEQDVMDAVQRMRAMAYDRKKLVTTKEQVVNVAEQQNRQVISIEPAVPDTLYVPYYEPQVVYGDWPYADYPAYPYYWGYPGYIAAGVIATGLAFGGAYALGRWASGGFWGSGGYWGGSRINWAGGAINVNRGAHVEHWRHDPTHRQGARYNNANLQQRFGNAGRGAGIAAGAVAGGAVANRARSGTGVNRPNTGDRAQRADRGNRTHANRPANRQAGSRQAANRSAASRNVRSGRTRTTSRAGNYRPAAGVRSAGGGRAAAFRGAGGARGGGGFRGGGGRGGGGRGGGGRRSDITLKHDVMLLGRLDNGLGYYRFAYNGSEKTYVGVIAQEVRAVRPDAAFVGRDGYLRVSYQRLGLAFRSYDDWAASGSRLPKLTSH